MKILPILKGFAYTILCMMIVAACGFIARGVWLMEAKTVAIRILAEEAVKANEDFKEVKNREDTSQWQAIWALSESKQLEAAENEVVKVIQSDVVLPYIVGKSVKEDKTVGISPELEKALLHLKEVRDDRPASVETFSEPYLDRTREQQQFVEEVVERKVKEEMKK